MTAVAQAPCTPPRVPPALCSPAAVEGRPQHKDAVPSGPAPLCVSTWGRPPLPRGTPQPRRDGRGWINTQVPAEGQACGTPHPPPQRGPSKSEPTVPPAL